MTRVGSQRHKKKYLLILNEGFLSSLFLNNAVRMLFYDCRTLDSYIQIQRTAI